VANVQLPKFKTTFGDIDNANFKGLQDIVKGLLNSTIMLTEELTYLLNNLDTRNVNEIDGDILVTGTITGDKIMANTITAIKMDVEQLSAIAADLGKITAGEIYGNYISTKETGYPKAEMSNTDNMFNVWASEGKGIQMKAFKSGSPFLDFVEGARTASMYYGSGSGLYLLTFNGEDLRLNPAGDVYLSPGGNVSVWSWDEIKTRSTGTTLQDELDTKVDFTDSVVNMTFDNTTRNLKLWNGNGGLVAQVNIP
jgi:hypothetical protein